MLKRILKHFLHRRDSRTIDRERALEALELLAAIRGDKKEQSLLDSLMARASGIDLKKLLLAVVGGTAVISLAESFARNQMTRLAMGREMKKQLAPINKKLDELEKQNEELRKQNEELKKKLR